MIFIDGLGIGEKDATKNPFFKRKYKFFEEIFGDTPHLANQNLNSGDKYIFPIDANMGVDDLPQSGTGQASIFCGVNAPQINGKHFGPFPPKSTLEILREKNILGVLDKRGYNVAFANCYPQIFFDYVESGKQRLSVTTLSCLMSNIRLKNESDLRSGNGLSAEITNSRWRTKLGLDVPEINVAQAVENLLKLSSENNFTLFEFFLTDHLGHGRIKDEFDEITNNLDEFLYLIFSNLPQNTTLLICSDHGNFEDISDKKHTRNPALGISAGKYAKELSQQIDSLDQIKPALMNIIDW